MTLRSAAVLGGFALIPAGIAPAALGFTLGSTPSIIAGLVTGAAISLSGISLLMRGSSKGRLITDVGTDPVPAAIASDAAATDISQV